MGVSALTCVVQGLSQLKKAGMNGGGSRSQLQRTHEDPGNSQSDRRRVGLLEGPSLPQSLPSRVPVEGDGGGGAQGAMSHS